jgi:quinol monooxygenase YgiN
MRSKWVVLLGTVLVSSSLVWAVRHAHAEETQGRVVRIAELEIDPADLEQYKAALRRGIETSIRVEPGVLMLYAVSVKDHPEQIRIFEMYANQAAYEAHLQTAHFKRYKAETEGMVRSLRLVETEPVFPGSKLK